MSQSAAIGRLGQACDRWIYTACLCFGLDLAEQQDSGFRYAYSVYQAEYSRNLIFASGARMDRVFGTIADRTRSRLDVPALRTLFGVKKRPAGTAEPSLKLAVVIERPAYDLTLFKVHFGLLTLKGYTKGLYQRCHVRGDLPGVGRSSIYDVTGLGNRSLVPILIGARGGPS